MSHYSNLTNNIGETTPTYWNNIELSPKTVQERERVKWGIDNFASFSWRGIDAFETFGAFIINNKNSLKFYNGPSFSNEYTKPQFETAAGQLTGVTFQTQKIDFMIGVYWISEEHYRQMIYWLHPYEINTLTFGFEPNYYYQVKLSSIDNGNRYIVGYEDGKPMYYTEMKVTFEIQGAPVAYGNLYFLFKEPFWESTETFPNFHTDSLLKCDSALNWEYDKRESDLETPLIIETSINLEKIIQRNTSVTASTDSDLIFSAVVSYDDQNSQKLFEVTFKNLHFGTNTDGTANHLNITYNSESALLFLQYGDSRRELLTKLTTLTTGDRIIDSMSVEQFRIPGKFDDYQFELKNMTIHYELAIVNPELQFVASDYDADTDIPKFFTAQIYSRPRTNLI